MAEGSEPLPCVHLERIPRLTRRVRMRILTPEHWMCGICQTTESIWACLSCDHFACGRQARGHALQHFKKTEHPLVFEINQKLLHCYKCDSFLFEQPREIMQLRQELDARRRPPAEQVSETRKGTPLRSTSLDIDPLLATVDLEARDLEDATREKLDRLLLKKVFAAWVSTLPARPSPMPRSASSSSVSSQPSATPVQPRKPGEPAAAKPASSAKPPARHLRDPKPCMTGLRNLGQTCFLNSVLQALLNSELLRLCLLSLGEQGLLDPASAPESIDELRATSLNSKSQAPRRLNRQTTVECHDVLEDKSLLPSLSRKRRGANEAAVQPDTSSLSFCHKLESLFRVIWSGKWPVVTPHAILSSVWQLIPSFRGFQQQDAQELLCEMVEQIQTELDELSHRVEPAELPALNVLRRTFGGQVSNTVKCLNCKAASRRVEPFFDLSLDFPPDSPLTLSAFLEYFVREELFDGPIYQCDSCSKGKSAEIQYRNASKCTRITLLPALLRVHLKRFRWQGIKREKIASHVDFPLQLDMERFCEANTARDTYDAAGVKQTSSDPDAYLYDLLGVIVHHGKGINSGHYTAYCHNPVTSAWTHCNDAKVTPCSLREVLEEDVYILVYSYRPASKFVSLLQSNGDFTSKRRKSVHE